MFVRLLTSKARLNGYSVDIDPQLGSLTFLLSLIFANLSGQLLARLPLCDRPSGQPRPRPVALARRYRLGMGDLTIAHPQGTQALFVQVSTR